MKWPLDLAKLGQTFDFLRHRKTAYTLTFRSPAGAEVLRDLAKFCRANTTTFHADVRVSAALDGRRDVFLRILQHLNLSVEEMFDLYGGQYPVTQKEE